MKNIHAVIDVPEDVYRTLSANGLSKETISRESRKMFALKCYRDKILSLGKAAELSGLSKWDFIEFLSENHVSVIKHDEINIKREFETVEILTHELKK